MPWRQTAKPIVKGHATRSPIFRPPMIIAKMVFVIVVYHGTLVLQATEETWGDRSVPARRDKEIVMASISATPDMPAKKVDTGVAQPCLDRFFVSSKTNARSTPNCVARSNSTGLCSVRGAMTARSFFQTQYKTAKPKIVRAHQHKRQKLNG